MKPIEASHRLFLVGFVLLVGVLLISPAGAQVQGVTDKEIKIGLFGPLTGPIALYGKGAHMDEVIYKELINERGGVNGRKITIIAEDTAGDVIKGVAAVKKLTYQDQVFMLHGGRVSNVVLAAKKDIVESGIPFMCDGAAAYTITTPLTTNIYTGVFTSAIVAHSMVDFAMSKPGTKRVAIIKHTDEWGQSFYNPVVEYLKSKYGVTPASDVTIEAGVADATPQVLELKRANPDVIIAITYVIPTSTFLRDAHKYELTVPIVGNPAINVTEQYDRVGIPEALKQFFGPHYFKYPLDHPVMDKWRVMLQKYYPKDSWDANPGLSIGGALAVVEGLKRAGRNLTRDSFLHALEGLGGFSPEDYPMATPIGYSPTSHVAITNVNFAVILNGKLRVLTQWKDYENALKEN